MRRGALYLTGATSHGDLETEIEAALRRAFAEVLVADPATMAGCTVVVWLVSPQPGDRVDPVELDAVRTCGARVIPVLVDGATLPADAPEQAASPVRISADWFDADLARLVEVARHSARPKQSRPGWPLIAVVIACATATSLCAGLVETEPLPHDDLPLSPRVSRVVDLAPFESPSRRDPCFLDACAERRGRSDEWCPCDEQRNCNGGLFSPCSCWR